MSEDQITRLILEELKELHREMHTLREEVAVLKVKMQWGSGLIATVTSVIVGVLVNIFSSQKL